MPASVVTDEFAERVRLSDRPRVHFLRTLSRYGISAKQSLSFRECTFLRHRRRAARQSPRRAGARLERGRTVSNGGSRAMAAGQAPKKQAPWKGFVAGSTGAMLSGAVTHPIDLVKVRMQLYGAQDGFQAASGAKPSAPPGMLKTCLLYTSPSPRDLSTSRMPSSA